MFRTSLNTTKTESRFCLFYMLFHLWSSLVFVPCPSSSHLFERKASVLSFWWFFCCGFFFFPEALHLQCPQHIFLLSLFFNLDHGFRYYNSHCNTQSTEPGVILCRGSNKEQFSKQKRLLIISACKNHFNAIAQYAKIKSLRFQLFCISGK